MLYYRRLKSAVRMITTSMQLVCCLLVSICFAEKASSQLLLKAPTTQFDQRLTVNPQALNCIVMGDWGRNGADHQLPVAKQMGLVADSMDAQFIIAVGDNFYPSGVISEHDPLFWYSFENIYTAFSLQWDWYVVLGNHDYKSNPDAQVAYSKISRRWKMPARYYSKQFAINGDTTKQVLILFIDTNPLIPEFYSNKEYGPNVAQADSAAQKRWIENELKNASANVKWKIVVGHHPMYTGGSRTDGYDTKAIRNTLKPLFDKYGVDLFIAGHEHSLQHLQAGHLHQLISGAASESTPARLVPESLMANNGYGFMTLSITPNNILVQAIDDNGKVIYKNNINHSN